ncbi:MAG: hypothetical protein CME32_08320 [Gimesia sp.]|nr:hypothetical protein [Gimesia sp.]
MGYKLRNVLSGINLPPTLLIEPPTTATAPCAAPILTPEQIDLPSMTTVETSLLRAHETILLVNKKVNGKRAHSNGKQKYNKSLPQAPDAML